MFYKLWKEKYDNNLDDSSFIEEFLKSSMESIAPLVNASFEDLKEIIHFLIKYPINNLLDHVNNFSHDIQPSMIMQFSNFENAVYKLPIILDTEDKCLSFDELGKKLVNAKLVGACKKYGENHSKVAKECGFVTFDKNGGLTLVQLTNLGKIITYLSKEVVFELTKKLLLRNYFIQNIISYTKKNIVLYSDVASCLSQSTLVRRKGNNKYLLNLILKKTNYEILLNNIIW